MIMKLNPVSVAGSNDYKHAQLFVVKDKSCTYCLDKAIVDVLYLYFCSTWFHTSKCGTICMTQFM